MESDDNWEITLIAAQSQLAPLSLLQVGHTAIQREWGMRAGARNEPVVPNQIPILVREMPWLASSTVFSLN